mgnify:CR=1 FL=1
MNTLGVLEAQLKSVNEKAYDYADSVLNKRTLENISITYLEEIGNAVRDEKDDKRAGVRHKRRNRSRRPFIRDEQGNVQRFQRRMDS